MEKPQNSQTTACHTESSKKLGHKYTMTKHAWSDVILSKREAISQNDANPHMRSTTKESLDSSFMAIEQSGNYYSQASSRNQSLVDFRKLVDALKRRNKVEMTEVFVPAVVKGKVIEMLAHWLKTESLADCGEVLKTLVKIATYCDADNHSVLFDAGIDHILIDKLFDGVGKASIDVVEAGFELLYHMFSGNCWHISMISNIEAKKLMDQVKTLNMGDQMRNCGVVFISALCTELTQEIWIELTETIVNMLLDSFRQVEKIEVAILAAMALSKITNHRFQPQENREELHQFLFKARFYDGILELLSDPANLNDVMTAYTIQCLVNALSFKNSIQIDRQMLELPSLIKNVCGVFLFTTRHANRTAALNCIRQYLLASNTSNLHSFIEIRELWPALVSILTTQQTSRNHEQQTLAMTIVGQLVAVMTQDMLEHYTNATSADLTELVVVVAQSTLHDTSKCAEVAFQVLLGLLQSHESEEDLSPPLQVIEHKHESFIEEVCDTDVVRLQGVRQLAECIRNRYLNNYPFKA